MRRRLCLLAGLLWAGLSRAQPAGVMEPPALPLRNLLIEVRIEEEGDEAQQTLGAGVQAQVQPGASAAELALRADSRQRARRTLGQQQVLVLNGRPAALLRGQAVPLRLRQLVTQGGVQRLVAGTVWLQAGTGLTATPLWQGDERVWLELAASQAAVGAAASAARTTLLLPLETWVTVAESDEALQEADSGLALGGAAQRQRTGRALLRVQVRVSLR